MDQFDMMERHSSAEEEEEELNSVMDEEDDGGWVTDSEAEVELSEDGTGRIQGSSRCHLVYEPAVRTLNFSDRGNSITDQNRRDSLLAQLHADCEKMFDGSTTFWLPATAKPRCTVEALARSVFEHHVFQRPKFNETPRQSLFDLESSGCEFWVQRRQCKSSSSSRTTKHGHDTTEQPQLLVNDASSIGFHWDKDEELKDMTNANVHPQISTITYLSDSSAGAPTVILNALSSHVPNVEFLGNDDEDDSGIVDHDSPTSLSHGWISYPEQFKHVSFDGRFLHGCPDALSVSLPSDVTKNGGQDKEEPQIRLTFLVNIWLNHKPIGLERLPQRLLRELSGPPQFEFQLDNSRFSLTMVEPSSSSLSVNIHQHKRAKNATSLLRLNANDEFGQALVHFGPNGHDFGVYFSYLSAKALQRCASGQQTFYLPYYRLNSKVSPRLERAIRPPLNEVPSLTWGKGTAEHQKSQLWSLYKRYQVVVVRSALAEKISTSNNNQQLLHKFQHLYQQFSSQITDNWNVETGNDSTQTQPQTILQKSVSTSPKSSWYVSFVVNDKEDESEGFSKQSKHQKQNGAVAPSLFQACLETFPELSLVHQKVLAPEVLQTSNLWCFFGCHNEEKGEEKKRTKKRVKTDQDGLLGRREHTDDISHNGTWHIQLSGEKKWFIRPNVDAGGEHWCAGPPPSLSSSHLSVTLHQGDVLLINTAAWFHSTRLPLSSAWSCSLARDFYLKSIRTDLNENSDVKSVSNKPTADMMNLQDTWAEQRIASGSIVTQGTLSSLQSSFRFDGVEFNCLLTKQTRNSNKEETTVYDVVTTRTIPSGHSLIIKPLNDKKKKGFK